jgi:PAS domain S-box-containing protein
MTTTTNERRPVGAQSDEAFRLLVDSVEDYAIFLLDPDGRVLSWNRGAQRIKGYAPSEIIGQHFSVFYTEAERAAGRPMRLLGEAFKNGRIEDEGWRVRRDGTRFWADVIVTALVGKDGAPYAFAKVTRDLTERRAAEEQQRTLLAEQRARAAAEEALVTRDRFLAIASHELRTPVASLQLAIDGLEHARAAGRLDANRVEVGLRRMSASVARLGALVAELLDVNRLESVEGPFNPVPVDLVEVAGEVLARFGDTGHDERLRLNAPPMAPILADASQLDQLITNVVDNALKYSPAPAPVEIHIAEEDGGVTLAVADEGIGLDVAAQDRLFEAFGRGENVAHTGGMGLGLYICRQIVERHGGRISVRPGVADGSGTLVSVWLPSEPVH